MDVNSRDPSQNIIPFRIKGVDIARFDALGNFGIGTTTPSVKLDVAGTVRISGDLIINGTSTSSLSSSSSSGVVINMDSQPLASTALNRQKKQSIPLASSSTLSTSDVIAKMSGVSVGKTQSYGIGPAQTASYGNIVVAVGDGVNSIAYSLSNPPTASSWVGIPNSANTFITRGLNIAYANGTWVAAGEGTNVIAYSTMTPPVASSWVGVSAVSLFNNIRNTFDTRVYDIAYGNGAWVAVGSGINSIAYSLANPPTAETWVAIPLTFSPTVFNNNPNSITFGNGTWVATGYGNNGIAYSVRTPPTADSWTTVPISSQNDNGSISTFSSGGINIIYANGVWLIAGQGTNPLCYSVENPPIAGSWMPITLSAFGVGSSISYGNGTWVACSYGGSSNTIFAYSTSRIPHSSSWVAMRGPTPASSGETINNISFNSATNTWYFLGDISSNCMFYSTQTPPVPATWVGVQRSVGTFTTQAYGAIGITTSAFTSPINVARLDNKVTFPVNRMLAVGGGGSGADVLARSALTPAPEMTGTISYSDDDGETWAMVPGGATNSMFSSSADIVAGTSFGLGGSRGANAVAWNGEKWVAAGNGRTNSLAFSDDGGMTWTGITGKSIFSVEARDVTWNGQMWVAVGRGAIFSTAYSYDGITWMGPIDASGAPINVFSYDIAGSSASESDISGGANHVIWNGKMWVATGTRTQITGTSPAEYYTIAYSVDGKTWVGVPDSGASNTGFDIYAHGIAWNGRNYVATGRGTTNTLVNFTDVSGSSAAAVTASWQGLGKTVFSVWGRGITWGAKRWMATGRGTNTVAYSTNGRNWQGCGANIFKPMRRFMAMGDTGAYTGMSSGEYQRGVAITYSDDGVTWDAPVVNQGIELTTLSDTIYTNQMLVTNVITDNRTQHKALMYSTDAGASWARVPGSGDTSTNGGTDMTIANSGALSLAMNQTRSRFLVGGGDSTNATRKVYFSNDGFNWRNSIGSPNSTQMAWVTAALWVGGSYNRWLIGGSDATTNTNGRIMYSNDANATGAWQSSMTIANQIISCFAANSDFSIINAGSASDNGLLRSVDGGINWSGVGLTSIGGVRSIAFSPSLVRWVVVGGSGGAANTILYSTNALGTSWAVPTGQAKASPTAIFKNGSEVSRVIWDAVGGRFIVGGWNGQTVSSLTNIGDLNNTNNNPGYTIAYSADGINWTPATILSSDDSGIGLGASSFGPFLTRCQDIMALDTAGDFTPINTGYSVSWNSYANRFVATGNGTTPVVYSSDGGVTWTPANQQPQQQAIAVAGGVGALAGTTSISPLTYTIDGKTWSQSIGAKEIFGTGVVNVVTYGQTSTAVSPNGRIWVAGGTTAGGPLNGSSLAFSQNGIRWTSIINGTNLITNVRTIVYAPIEQLSLSSNAVITATSGVGNGVWVAGGDDKSSLIFSYDGISWGEVPNSLTILSRCNACAFGNGLFVAGGFAATGTTAIDTTANMVYSTDGISWRPIRNSVSQISSGASISSITYGRDENGRGIWVAGAASSSSFSLLYSYNGIDWIGVMNSGAAISSINVSAIAYGVSTTSGRGLWVATVHRSTSDGNAFVFSTNGRDGWTAVPNTKTMQLFDTNNGGPTGIAYLNGVWYAAGPSTGISTGRTLAYSYEGSSNWFGVYPTTNIYGSVLTTFSLTDMRCVATTNDYIVPSGASAGSLVSTGTGAASFRPGSLIPVRSIGWTAGVGSGYLQHPTLVFGADNSRVGTTSGAISADGGRTWGSSTVSLARSAFRGGVCNDAFWNGTTWVAVGNDTVTGSKAATSKDGVSWTQISSTSIPITGALNTVTWNGSIWMVGGDGSPSNDINTASFAWSSDLTTWNALSNTDISMTVVKRIAWNGMYWVAVGQGVNTTIMYSKNKNGLVWEDTFRADSSSTKTSTMTTIVNDVVWGGGRWVAVGRGNSISNGGGVSILYSVDTPAAGSDPSDNAISGRRWVGITESAYLFPYGANSVAWNGKRFIATGPASASCSTSNIIAWSVDGISWNGYSTTKTVAPGQRWVAVGSGSRACIALSADGRVWRDISGSAALFSDISGASSQLVNRMKTGARAVGWNGSSLVVGGARSATTVTASSQATANSSIGRKTIPVCAFIGSGNGVMGGGTTNGPMNATAATYLRASSSVFITHMDVNIRESSAPYADMWLNTYTDLSGTQLFQVTPESHTFSSALKWNGWSWVANFGLTTINPVNKEQYGSIWYCTDPLARVGWSVASNSVDPRILIGQGGYAALEWNGVAWLACGYDPNNNNLIYTTDKYGAVGWSAVSGIVSGAGSASFQPVCIASSSRYWVVGGSQAISSALYYTSDRTGATGWRRIMVGSVLPGIRISSVAYNGSAWICCGGGGGGTSAPAASISWRTDTGTEDILKGWTAVTSGIPPILSNGSAIMYNAGAPSPMWVIVGDASLNAAVNQIAYTTTPNGSSGWNIATGTLTNTLFRNLNGIAWTGYSWIATSGAGSSRLLSTTDVTAATGWNSSPTNSIYTPTLCTNAVAYANIPISLLTTGMPTTLGSGAGTGALWRGGVGRAQGLLAEGGMDTTSVIARSVNGAEGTSWSPVYSRNFLIAVGGGIIRDASNVGGTNRMAYSYDGGLSWTTNNTPVLTNASSSAIGSIRTVKYGNGIWVAGGDASGSSVSGNNCMAWSLDGVNWNGGGGTQIFGSAGSCYAVCCNDRGRWVAVGGSPMTTAGTYTNTSGSIYTMAWSDDGMNWTPILGSRALFGIVCQGVSYGKDNNGVGMWTAIGRGSAYTGCAYSYDGKTWFLSQTSGSLFGTSTNVLTERYSPAASVSWNSISVSSTGQYQSAIINAGYVYTSADYGVSWTARITDTPRNWRTISVSSTGQYQSANHNNGYIYTSNDYGVSWTTRDAVRVWLSISISSTGQYQSAGQSTGNIYISSNYGINWSPITNGIPVNEWVSISVSSSGQYQSALIASGTVTNNIYISSNYGISWTVRTPSNGAPAINGGIGICVSSTGQYQSACFRAGQIYISSDYGNNWVAKDISRQWYSISMSSTGKYQTAVVNGGQIYISSDIGMTWFPRDINRSWISVSVSSTGQYQTAVADTGQIVISSNFGETWSATANDSRSLGITYGKNLAGTGMWVATAGRRDRDISENVANTMAYSYDGKLWRGITAAAGLSEQAWSVAYGKDGFGVGMWVAAGYDRTCGLKWSYDGITWNASMGASGAAVWASMAAGRRAISVYWNGSMWLASTSDTRNGSPNGTGIAANNASSIPGYLLYSYNGKNWLPVLSPNTYNATISTTAQPSIYSVLPNPVILDFGSFYDDQTQRGTTITNTTTQTVGSAFSGVPIKNVNTIVPYGRGSLATGQVPFLLGGDSGLVDWTPNTNNAYDNFIFGPSAQSTNNNWQYFKVNQSRSVASLLSSWQNGNDVIPTYGQWDGDGGGSTPFIQKVTGVGLINGVGVSFTGPALVVHPENLDSGNIGIGYKNNTGNTINISVNIGLSLLFPVNNTEGVNYYIQRGLANDSRYQSYVNSRIPGKSTTTYTFYNDIELLPGEIIYLIVNRNTEYFYDHTKVDFNVTVIQKSLPITSELAASTSSLSTSTDGGVSWRAVPNSTRVMTKVNKILCDETTQQIVAVGTGNYSVATSTPATAANADGWTGVFGSRMTDTRAGLFEKYGTCASWLGGAKMWIASGRAQSRRGSSLAVSVNGTVWQDAKFVSQTSAGAAGARRGGGLVSRTTINTVNSKETTTVVYIGNSLYEYSGHTFTSAGVTGYYGPSQAQCVAAYTSKSWASNTNYFSVGSSSTNSGYQYWTVPATGSYTIELAGGQGGSVYSQFYGGIASGSPGAYCSSVVTLTKGTKLGIVVGQTPRALPESEKDMVTSYYSYAPNARGRYLINYPTGATNWAIRSTHESFDNESLYNLFSGNWNQTFGPQGTGNSADNKSYVLYVGGPYSVSPYTANSVNTTSVMVTRVDNAGKYTNVQGFEWIHSGGHNYPNDADRMAKNVRVWRVPKSAVPNTPDVNLINPLEHGSYSAYTYEMNLGAMRSEIRFQEGSINLNTHYLIFQVMSTFQTTSQQVKFGIILRQVFGSQGAGGGGGSFLWNDTDSNKSLISAAGGGGGTASQHNAWSTGWKENINNEYGTVTLDGNSGGNNKMEINSVGDPLTNRPVLLQAIGTNGNGGRIYNELAGGGNQAGPGAGWKTNGTFTQSGNLQQGDNLDMGGKSFANGFLGGSTVRTRNGTGEYEGGFGGGGAGSTARNGFVTTLTDSFGGGGGGYSGGGTVGYDGDEVISGGSGGIYSIGTNVYLANGSQQGNGFVKITPNFVTVVESTQLLYNRSDINVFNIINNIIPYTSNATQLLTYSDSATAFSTQVSSVAVNSQYNRAVVGGSGVQFVAGGRGGNSGIAYSNDGYNWTAAAGTGVNAVFQTPTNVTTRTGNGGFDASFGTVALTQKLTTPATYPNSNFLSVSLSKTGQYQIAGALGGSFRTSSDYGVSWVNPSISESADWRSLSLSSTGQYQTAVVNGVNIWTSSDYGVSWADRTTGTSAANKAWYSVSLSSTGQYQTAVINAGNIWTSSDYGVNWTERTTGGVKNWYSVSLSSTGQYQTAVGQNGANIWTSSDYGVSWADRTTGTSAANKVWSSVSLSSTGQYQTAVVNGGNIWTSTDFGTSWTERTTGGVKNWYSVSLSSNGQYQTSMAESGNIWTSSDYGINWTERTTSSTKSWRSVSLSSTGQYQTAVAYPSSIHTSSNYGVNWVERSTATRTNAFTRIKSSASGKYQLATSGPTGNTNGQLYVSSDYGEMWMPRRELGTWLGGAVSGTGAIMMSMTLRSTKPLSYLNSTILPNAFYVRTGGTNWRDYIPLLTANTTINIQTWGADTQFATEMTPNDIAKQFSYFAGYWLNVNKATTGQSFSVPTYTTAGLTGIFTFTATSNYPVSTYSGSLTAYNSNATYTLTPQTDGTAAGTSPLFSSIIRSTDYGTNFSDVVATTLVGTSYWQAISATNSAALQSAVAYGGAIYRSINYGETWSDTGITIDGGVNSGRNWKDIAISSETGAVQVACANSGYIYYSTNSGVTWTSGSVNIDGVSSQTTNRPWQAVALSANGQYGLACVNGGYIYRTVNSGALWTSSTMNINGAGTQTTIRAWQDVGMSANGKYQVACINGSNIFYSKDYGLTWSPMDASLYYSSVALSDNGSTISATTNDSAGAIFTYTMPDDQYYLPAVLANSGSSTTVSTVRAVAYGNSGTGAATDGYWVAGADASANSLAYSSNGIDWTAVVGSKTTLFNSVNGVAYGSDTTGTPMWVAVGLPFVGSVPGVTAYSIAYSYNMTTWIGVRNNANFTGQGNHVSYGQDEYGEGIWVAVGQDDGVLSANLGNSAFGNSNGNTNATIFYSYDGANWSAATGAGVFATSGTDVTWGVDASGVSTWVATGVGYTDPLTGVFISGGQVANSTNGRIWTPIRALLASGLSATTLPATTRGHAIPAPPLSTGFATPTYNNIWKMLGTEIDGEALDDQSGYSVSLSADGTVVAIGAPMNDGTTGIVADRRGHVRVYELNSSNEWVRRGGDIDGSSSDNFSGRISLSADGTTLAIGSVGNGVNGNNAGQVRVYKHNPLKVTTPVGWEQFGGDINGEAAGDYSGCSVAISADGNRLAIGAQWNGGTGFKAGHVRVYKYNQAKVTTPVGWDKLGDDIDGELAGDELGYSVSISADGNTVAIGARYANNPAGTNNTGHIRVYRYNQAKSTTPVGWDKLGDDIDGVEVSDESGTSVAISADGTTVAIGTPFANTPTTTNDIGCVRVYKYNLSKVTTPVGWDQMGSDIYGEDAGDQSGWSVALSADGTILAIGAKANDVPTTVASDDRGHVRVYKYNQSKTVAITDKMLPNFGPIGWDKIGLDIDGEAPGDRSGYSISLSADGTTLAIGADLNDGVGQNAGHVRIYKLDVVGAITYTSSNSAIAEIYGNSILLIKEGVTGTTTITATQSAVSPFTVTPAFVQGILTVSGTTTYSLVYNNVLSVYTPFTGTNASALTVAYGRDGAQGIGTPLWIVGGSGGTNVFARSSRPSATTTGTWSVVASNAAIANAPFSICNSVGYSNGVWVAGNNTDATNVLARSTNGGVTWTPIATSSMSGVITGASAIGSNAFCNYTLAYADFSSDRNLMSWNAIEGTKNFMFDGGVNTVATVTPNVNIGIHNSYSIPWWVAGGVDVSGVASLASTTNPGGTIGWTKATSPAITNLASINAIAFSPFTNRWLAVGAGTSGSTNTNVLYSDVSGTSWTSTAVATALTPVITLNTCIWNQLPTSATISSSGRWLAAGTRNGTDANSASIYISTDVSGSSTPWVPITGTGAILSQVYSLAYNGRVWIAAGVPATGNGSTSSLMRTVDPSGASGWQGIPNTNTSAGGFDTAARSITWNADQQMWVATGENTGSVSDASFSSMIYSLDVSGSVGMWRSVRETNSLCFSGEGNGIAFKGDKWFAAGQGANQIVATTGTSAANAAAATWTPISHGTGMIEATDIVYTGRKFIATGISGTTNGVIVSLDNSGSMWQAPAATPGPGLTDGGTSITFEPSYGGKGLAVATGRSSMNTLSVSTDGGASWSEGSVQTGNPTYLYEKYGPITSRIITDGFPTLNALQNWVIDISFTVTGGANTWRPLVGSMYNSIDPIRGWGIWVGNQNQISFSDSIRAYDSFLVTVALNTVYNLNITKIGSSVTFKLINITNPTTFTNTHTVTNPLGIGPVDIFGFSNGETFLGTIGYVVVSAVSTTTQPIFTTGGNSVAYVGNDTLFTGGGNDVQWTGKRWVATGRNSVTTAESVSTTTTSTASTSTPLIDVINNNTSAVATSADGITWQCVSASQAPNLTEGTVIVSNSRIGPTPIINSQIVITDGGDTEANVDYGGMIGGMGGNGSSIAQIDIISELTPVSTAASSGAVTILGSGSNGGANGVGNAQNASFDNTAFTITTRPL